MVRTVTNNEIASKLSEADQRILAERRRDREIITQNADPNEMSIMSVNPVLWAREPVAGMPRGTLWDFELLQVPYIWSYYGVRGRGVTTYVVDSGLNQQHPCFAHHQGVYTRSFLPGVDSTEDGSGHGTWVAGKIGGAGVGIAPGCQLKALRVLDDSGTGSSKFTIKALQHILQDEDADLVNLSLGSLQKDTEQEKTIWKLYKKGVLVVAAAGNYGSKDLFYPAAYDGVLTVGAVDKNMVRARFSNYGGHLEIVAPGVACYGPYLGASYRELQGTSMAAPTVSGLLTLGLSYAKQRIPGMKKVERRDLILKCLFTSAQDLGPKGKDIEYGFGGVSGAIFFTKLHEALDSLLR